MDSTPQYRKKLIEVALPLEAINKESAREKSIRHGHPSTLHLWWARRPLAACRAVLFASLVDDPSAWPELFPTEEKQKEERQRLFKILEELVVWKNSNNPDTLFKAHSEIARSISRNRGEKMPEGAEAIRKYIAENAPPVLDPFCGGGSIPLEAQRLGLEAHGSDLNPVAVLITKALIEIPPKFAGKPPVNPEARAQKTITGKWEGAKGLAEDVRYYGKWMRDEAEKRIGHLYPKVKVTAEMAKDRPDLQQYVDNDLTVIAWLWARTIQCPNPGCGARTPLVRSFYLSKKTGTEIFADPILDKEKNRVLRFDIKTEGEPQNNTTDAKGARCLFCNTFIKKSQLREIAFNEGIEEIPLAIVAKTAMGRIYLPCDKANVTQLKKPNVLFLDQLMANDRRWFSPPLYGLPKFSDIFTSRQIVMLTTYSDLIAEVRLKIIDDAKRSDLNVEDNRNLDSGGIGSTAYADAVVTYLAEAVSKLTTFNNSLALWRAKENKSASGLGRQAFAMTWDFAEINPFAEAGGDFQEIAVRAAPKVISSLPGSPNSIVTQLDARTVINTKGNPLISTDPPYYDNIGYADLSDFFYIWLRSSLKEIYPSTFATVLTPKNQELIAAVHRHGGNTDAATSFFEEGLEKAFLQMYHVQNQQYPLTLYYAFKQTENNETDQKNRGIVSTGWEKMLTGLIQSGFSIIGTWPVRTEQLKALKAEVNALASSIVLVCRPRPANAPLATRREFITALKQELPPALKTLQQSSIAPVDLAQAAIGPGMAVFTRYSKVMESDGAPMTVRTALAFINETLDEVLAEQEGEFDADTRWALAWFEQYGMNEGAYGTAETLSKAKNTAINALVNDGLITARTGKVKLVPRNELPEDWNPVTDRRLTAWESTQHLIWALEQKGENGAADLLKKLGSGMGETARALAYRLYIICDRKKWTTEALSYNSLITSWSEIQNLVQATERTQKGQQTLVQGPT